MNGVSIPKGRDVFCPEARRSHPEPRTSLRSIVVVPEDLLDRSPILFLCDQPFGGRSLCCREVPLERIVGVCAKSTEQADPDGAAIVPLDMGANLGLRTTRRLSIAEPNHGAAFYELLDRVLPDWQHRKQRLERIMA